MEWRQVAGVREVLGSEQGGIVRDWAARPIVLAYPNTTRWHVAGMPRPVPPVQCLLAWCANGLCFGWIVTRRRREVPLTLETSARWRSRMGLFPLFEMIT